MQRIVVVGAGSIGKRHIRIARTLMPKADIRVLRHQDDTVPEFSNGVFTSIQDAVAFAPEIGVIANPAPFHVAAALALAECGADVLAEKPLAEKADAALPLLQLCRVQRRILQVAYNLRFLPSLARFRELVVAGAIGRVQSVRCEIGQYLPSWRPSTNYREGVSARRALGGGVLLELSHEIDYLRWIFGEFDWVKATLGHQSALEVDVEDTAHLTIGFAQVNGEQPLLATLNMDFIRHDTTRRCVAIGDQGSLRWNGIAGTVEQYRQGEKEWGTIFRHVAQRDESYLAEWKHFLDCIQSRTSPLIGGEDGLAVLRLVDAARLSAVEDRRIFVTASGIDA
jgi:predicted dehydrogenase